MAIYDKPVRELIPEMVNELAPERRRLFSRDAALAWFKEHYPKIKRGTITAHLYGFSTNAPTRVHYARGPDEDLLYQIDRSRFRLYEPENDPEPIRPNQDASLSPEVPEEEDESAESSGKFAYESDLRDFLARNLSVIEPGLKLYQDEEITGVEFPVGGRFVDILATDAQGRFVVIELKVSRGYDRVVGQLLRYMAWIEKNQAEPGQEVRGIIAAREISEDLLLACSSLPNVELYEYELSVTLRQIDPAAEA